MKKYTNGFSILEIVIVFAILASLTAVFLPSFSAFRDEQLLKNTTDDIVAILNQARTHTLSSKNSNFYSVHFESDKATLFTGGTFTQGLADNVVVGFDSRVTLPSANVSLNGGGADVIFDRLSGDSSTYGTITIELASDASKTKTINVEQTGIISAN